MLSRKSKGRAAAYGPAAVPWRFSTTHSMHATTSWGPMSTNSAAQGPLSQGHLAATSCWHQGLTKFGRPLWLESRKVVRAAPASFDLKGFQTRYSVLSMVPGSVPGFCTLTRFSPYTLSPTEQREHEPPVLSCKWAELAVTVPEAVPICRARQVAVSCATVAAQHSRA